LSWSPVVVALLHAAAATGVVGRRRSDWLGSTVALAAEDITAAAEEET